MATRTATKPSVNGGTIPVLLNGMGEKQMVIRVVGTSPLVIHNFDEKSRRMMLEKMQGKLRPRTRDPKDPDDEFQRARYLVHARDGTVYDAIRAISFKAAIATAALLFDKPLTKALVHRCLHIPAEFLPILSEPPVMREDVVRLEGRTSVPDLRYRPEYSDWACEVPVEFVARHLPEETVIQLFETAGFCIGVGEGRPDKSGGSWGRFAVDPNYEIVVTEHPAATAGKRSLQHSNGPSLTAYTPS